MLRVLRLHIVMEALENVELPPFAGSTLRGAFMTALKNRSCMSAEICGQACEWPGACAYGQLCETPHPKSAPARVKSSQFAPHPYVLTPSSGGLYYRGDLLHFQLTLFGSALRSLPAVIEALEEMATAGIGKGRGKLRLLRVHGAANQITLFDGQNSHLNQAETEILDLSASREARPDASLFLKIEFLTPLKLQKQGRLVTELDAGELVYAAADRLYLLAACHGDVEQAPDPAHLAEKARNANIKILTDESRRVSFSRYSGRQERRHRLDGLLGRVLLVGDLHPFLPLFRAAERLHIGNGTSFGLGAFSLDLQQAPARSTSSVSNDSPARLSLVEFG